MTRDYNQYILLYKVKNLKRNQWSRYTLNYNNTEQISKELILDREMQYINSILVSKGFIKYIK